MTKFITRTLLADRINEYFKGHITEEELGEEMFSYLEYKKIYLLDPKNEELIIHVLGEFRKYRSDGADRSGYVAVVPSKERLQSLRDTLIRGRIGKEGLLSRIFKIFSKKE